MISAASRAGLRISREPIVQAAAVEQLQRDERQAVRLADVVDLDDVRMAQPRDRLGLDPETREVVGPRLAAAANHLHGDQAVQPEVPRLVDDPHPALAQLLEDLVVRNRRPVRRRSHANGRSRLVGRDILPRPSRRRISEFGIVDKCVEGRVRIFGPGSGVTGSASGVVPGVRSIRVIGSDDGDRLKSLVGSDPSHRRSGRTSRSRKPSSETGPNRRRAGPLAGKCKVSVPARSVVASDSVSTVSIGLPFPGAGDLPSAVPAAPGKSSSLRYAPRSGRRRRHSARRRENAGGRYRLGTHS